MSDDFFDFGFTAVDETELEAVQKATTEAKEVASTATTTQDKLDKLMVDEDNKALASYKGKLRALCDSKPELELQTYHETFLRFMNSFLTASSVDNDSGIHFKRLFG